MPQTGTVDVDPVKLQELRRRRKLTQMQLARKAGYSRAAISNVEQGVALPSPRLAAAIATALGCARQELTVDGRDFEYEPPIGRAAEHLLIRVSA